MKPDWSYIALGVALGFAACNCAHAARAETTPPAETHVAGAIVADELPAIYRLPEVSEPKGVDATQTVPIPADDPSSNPLLSAEELAAEFEQSPRVATLPLAMEPAAEYRPDQAIPGIDEYGAWSAPQPLATFPYTPAPANLSAQLLPAVQRGYALAQRGAMSAARTEFIQVLRRIAQGKDAEHGTDRHSQALAEGLRALDEAQDFVPDGAQLEGELNVRIIASSHRTPVVRERADQVLSHEAVALYHTYAEERLARAVDGEQAGSMVLHGLGKVHSRVADRDDDLHAMRSAMTMYMAAVAACPTNHLAANELGVLLCRNGHAAEAAQLFEQTINLAPTSTNYHNLSIAQQKLGMHGQAAANEQEAQRLAAIERSQGALSRRAGVQWVSPQEMSSVAPAAPLSPTAYNASRAPEQQSPLIVGARPLPRSRWQRTKDFARSLPFPGNDHTDMPAGQSEQIQIAQPMPAPTDETQWR